MREYRALKLAIMRAYEEIGYLPEFYRVRNYRPRTKSKDSSCPEIPCYPQAWSSGTLLSFLEEK